MHEKIVFLGWGAGKSPKKGALDSLQIYKRNWQKKGLCFLGGKGEGWLRPQSTL